jgi:hypothetical protein
MKRLFVSMLLVITAMACNGENSSATIEIESPPPPIRYEAKTSMFCRPSEYETDFERHRALTRGALTELANEGWEYQGIIHNDGINCSVVYFRRVARPPQPSIVDAGVTGG